MNKKLFDKNDNLDIIPHKEPSIVPNHPTELNNIYVPEIISKKDKVYFVQNKGKVKFNINNTIFFPSNSTLLLMLNFTNAYLKQLESVLYNSREDIDTTGILEILMLYKYINKGKYPINIIVPGYIKLSSKICYTLNKFFNRNLSVINSIYTSFNSIIETENEQKENHD